MRAQRQIHPEHEAVFGRLADQRVQRAHHLREVFVGADRQRPMRVTAVFVEVDQVDVGRHVELAATEHAHSDHQ